MVFFFSTLNEIYTIFTFNKPYDIPKQHKYPFEICQIRYHRNVERETNNQHFSNFQKPSQTNSHKSRPISMRCQYRQAAYVPRVSIDSILLLLQLTLSHFYLFHPPRARKSRISRTFIRTQLRIVYIRNARA